VNRAQESATPGRPDYEIEGIARDGSAKHAQIDWKPTRQELENAYAVAFEAGLWRFGARAASCRALPRPARRRYPSLHQGKQVRDG
jgi:hypothetical protein